MLWWKYIVSKIKRNPVLVTALGFAATQVYAGIASNSLTWGFVKATFITAAGVVVRSLVTPVSDPRFPPPFAPTEPGQM